MSEMMQHAGDQPVQYLIDLSDDELAANGIRLLGRFDSLMMQIAGCDEIDIPAITFGVSRQSRDTFEYAIDVLGCDGKSLDQYEAFSQVFSAGRISSFALRKASEPMRLTDDYHLDGLAALVLANSHGTEYLIDCDRPGYFSDEKRRFAVEVEVRAEVDNHGSVNPAFIYKAPDNVLVEHSPYALHRRPPTAIDSGRWLVRASCDQSRWNDEARQILIDVADAPAWAD